MSGTDKCATTSATGAFLLSGIPLDSWDGQSFDLDVAIGGQHALLTNLLVQPGVMNAPSLRFSFTGTGDTTVRASLLEAASGSIALPGAQPAPAPRVYGGSASSIFATREGLVGGTTANGHVIVENDHFVALPSRRALNRSDSPSDLEFEVEVVNGERKARLPVWDIGPWNTTDDWWNTSAFRQSGQDLSRWTPWATAAFASGYNGGLDQKGRTVKNPAGIDLGDGAFRQDLAMTDNGLVGVRMLWQLDGAPGQRVRARHWAKVRATAGGTVLDTVQCGAKGTLISGPDSATLFSPSHWYLFYNVRWDDGTSSGWSAENFLSADTATSCTDAVHPTTGKTSLARFAGNDLVFGNIEATTEFVVHAADGSILMRSGPVRSGSAHPLPRSSGILFIVVRSGSTRQNLTRLP